jgi:hypothetical protein
MVAGEAAVFWAVVGAVTVFGGVFAAGCAFGGVGVETVAGFLCANRGGEVYRTA